MILSSRRADKLANIKSECSNPENIKILPFDLIDFKSASEIVNSAFKIFGTVDILINNAGVSQRSLIINTKFEVFRKLIEINYLGHLCSNFKCYSSIFYWARRRNICYYQQRNGKVQFPLQISICSR